MNAKDVIGALIENIPDYPSKELLSSAEDYLIKNTVAEQMEDAVKDLKHGEDPRKFSVKSEKKKVIIKTLEQHEVFKKSPGKSPSISEAVEYYIKDYQWVVRNAPLIRRVQRSIENHINQESTGQ